MGPVDKLAAGWQGYCSLQDAATAGVVSLYHCGLRRSRQAFDTKHLSWTAAMHNGPLHKRVLRSALLGRIASFLIAGYIRLVQATSKISYIGRENSEPLLAAKEGFILAFWHSRLLLAPTVRRETLRPVYMLISTHRDGEIIANAVKGFGIDFIRGSAANPKRREKDKSGAPAIAEMIVRLDEGAVVGVTPDGPNGPRQIAKIGVIKLAAYAGVPILPAAYAASRGWTLDTWDRFFLAGPFSRAAFAATAPIRIKRNATSDELEAARFALERSLDQALEDASAAIMRKPRGRKK